VCACVCVCVCVLTLENVLGCMHGRLGSKKETGTEEGRGKVFD